MEDDTLKPSLEAEIDLICSRPAMFLGNTRFETLVVYLTGFERGNGGEAQKAMFGFRYWLHSWLAETGYPKSEIPHNHSWEWYIQAVFPEDADAIKNLPLLFKEYLRQSDATKAVGTSD